MIELAIKGALERITGMNAYPLLLPDTVQKERPFSVSLTRRWSRECCERGSSLPVSVNLYRLDDYTSLLQLDKKSGRN